ncbi:proton/glutamate symport protein [hydrocarbon metagenome]|uniref:Proton/glutamate symport protein n=1 Tax=hydrocarbon metagenome TaxID=938273 RepID=A0A0W8E900_9ZZZZ
MNGPLYKISKSIRIIEGPIRDMLNQHLWAKMLGAMVLGVIVGLIISPSTGWFSYYAGLNIGNWLALPGQVFLSLIQMMVVPLVFTSIIRGIASNEDIEFLKKMGTRIVIYFLTTTTLAISIGISMAVVLKPGQYLDQKMFDLEHAVSNNQTEQPLLDTNINSLPDYFINILPDNPLQAMVETQMLQVVIFAVILGVALVSTEAKNSRPLLDLMDSIQEVCMIVVRWAMLIAPLAVFGLLAQITIKMGLEALVGMAAYVGTVLLSLLILLCMYCCIVFVITKMPPRVFLIKIRSVQLLAFSTSSSAAVMPLSIQTAEEELNVRPAISQFLIPLGTTINMDGTALYQGVAAVFLAQVFGVDLSPTAMLLILLTSVGASIGSPATPGVGIVILATILNSVGIPASGIAIILGVDRILDMSRTALNVTGDLTASMVMNRWLGNQDGGKDNYNML